MTPGRRGKESRLSESNPSQIISTSEVLETLIGGIILSKIFRTVPEFEIKEMLEANKPDFEVMVGR